MTNKYIHHVTLNTGHVAHQRRADVSEATIAALTDMLDGLLSSAGLPPLPTGRPNESSPQDGLLPGARMPLLGHPGYLLNASHHGHSLIVTLWGESGAPILTTATALRSRSGPTLWRMLHETSTVPLATRANDPPAAPWTADRIEIGAGGDYAALTWTGDLSRCLAWTWWSYRHG